MNIDRLISLDRQRRAQRMAADERRLRECLAVEAERMQERIREVTVTVGLRALGAACAVGSQAKRPHEDKSKPQPHPSDEGRKPLRSNWPAEDNKVYKRWRARQELGQLEKE